MPRLSILAVVVAGVLALVACTGGPVGGSGSASVPTQGTTTKAAPNPFEVFPEKGIVDGVLGEQGGKLMCEPANASTSLNIGRAVSYNGTTITVKRVDGGWTVTFAGAAAPFTAMIVNEAVALNLPGGLSGGDTPVLYLAESNFGPLTAIALCGGGQ